MEEDKKKENKFEVEMMRRIEHIILNLKDFNTRFDNLEKDVSQIKTGVKDVKADMNDVKTDIKVIKGQFSDVAVMAIEDNKRIKKLEKDVEELQSNIH
ncbi:MAG: hypothetical protein ACR2F2_00740 [Pyrinomonadaceae bacterium]